MNNDHVAIDTNIIIYAFDENLRAAKKLIALNIIAESPVFSSQVLSETINIFHKRWKYSKTQLMNAANFLLKNANLFPIDIHTVSLAHALIEKHDFQYFDALIVSSALQAKCAILYSKDMQHNMLVENQLTIINPFL